MSATMGLTFKIATNVSGTKTSFLTQEHWAGAPGNNLTSGTQEGASAGAIDTSTGDLWYESRIEREGCASSSHSCGFNRHTRIHAVLTMSGTTPSGLSTISFAFGNLQYNGGDQSGDLGMLIESSGSLATGIKARLWEVWHGGSVGSSPTAATDYDTIGNWQEYTNTKCYTNASETSSGCGTGLPLFTTSTKFMLNTDDSHTSPASWVASITGQTFTNVNVDSDTQF
jgi:hypothetical protein